MNYELAKKLKNAGFKRNQQSNGTDCGVELHFMPAEDFYVGEDGSQADIPTLSELIDISRPFLWQTYDEKWCAGNPTGTWNERTIDVDFDDEVGCGSTPEEAVAKLWLALNKNKE